MNIPEDLPESEEEYPVKFAEAPVPASGLFGAEPKYDTFFWLENQGVEGVSGEPNFGDVARNLPNWL